jgi:hypothetical protein
MTSSRRRRLVAAAAILPLLPGIALAQTCGKQTAPQTPGPFFKPDSPVKGSLFEKGQQSVLLVVTGTVLSVQCRPVANALLDFWHADEFGEYDNRGFRFRGHQFADAQGRWRLETILPGEYPGRARHITSRSRRPAGASSPRSSTFPPPSGTTTTASTGPSSRCACLRRERAASTSSSTPELGARQPLTRWSSRCAMASRLFQIVNVHLVDPDAHHPLVARPYDLLRGEQIRQVDLELVSDLQGLLAFHDKNQKDAVPGPRRAAAVGIARLDDRFHGTCRSTSGRLSAAALAAAGRPPALVCGPARRSALCAALRLLDQLLRRRGGNQHAAKLTRFLPPSGATLELQR